MKSRSLITLNIDETLFVSLQRMKKERLHRIAILDKESQTIVGALQYKDLLLYLIQNFKTDEYIDSEILNAPIEKLGGIGNYNKMLVIKDDQKVIKAFMIMFKNKNKVLPIVNGLGQFVDILTKKDLFDILEDMPDHFGLLNETIGNFLIYLKKIKTIRRFVLDPQYAIFTPKESLRTIVEKLVFAFGNTIIYVDENKIPLGIITLKDLFDFFTEDFS